MAEVRRTIPIVKQHSVLDDDGTNKGNSRHQVGIIGTIGDQTYREFIQAAFEWADTDHQLKDAFLVFWTSSTLGEGEVSVGVGAAQNVTIRALGEGFAATGGGGTNDWGTGASPVYPGPSVGLATTASKVLADGTGERRISVAALVEDIMPSRIKKRDGTPGGGDTRTHWGWRLVATNESTASNRTTMRTIRHPEARYRPVIVLVLDDAVPPPVPTVTTPSPSSGEDPTVVASSDGRTLAVTYRATARTGETITRAELEVYGPAATADEADPGTQPVTGSRLQTTGAIAVVPAGEANYYTITLQNVPARSERLFRLRVQSSKGAWSRWTPLDEGRIQTAYVPGVPIDPRLTTDPQQPVVSATLNSQDPADFVTAITGTFVRHNTDGTTTNLWPNLGVVPIGGTTTRPELPWAGVGLADGDRVSWTVTLYNRDGIASPPTAERTTVMRTQLGPTFDPADATEALQSRTGPIDIHDDTEFDAYRYRLYRNDVLIYTSLTIPAGPDTDATITLPEGYLTWGDTFGIEAETRPTDTDAFGPTSPRAYLYVNTLPSVGTWYASDGEGFTGPVLPTAAPTWHSEYDDPDAARFGEAPKRKLMEFREYAAVPGDGRLVDQRVGLSDLLPIPEDELTGFAILPLTSATGWVADADVSAGTVASAPTDYVGDSLRLTFASSSADRGVRYTFAEPLDLTGLSASAYLWVAARLSSDTNLSAIYLRLESSPTDYIGFEVSVSTLNTWRNRYGYLGAPDEEAGTVDLSAIESIRVIADVTGSFAGTLDLRDLTIGNVARSTTPPETTYAFELEERYSARVRYSDGAGALVTTALAAAVDVVTEDSNIKVDSVAGLVVGMDITIGSDTDAFQETRTIAAIGTAGSGGTGIDLADPLITDHADDDPVRVLPWGPWSPWLTVKVSEPPAVAAATPADEGTSTDPTQVFTFTFDSPAEKDQAYFTFRLFKREDGVDRLVYEKDVAGTDTSFTAPWFLLENGTDYAWEIAAYDTDGLYGTTERRTFDTDFTALSAVTNLTATADPTTSTVTLSWTYVSGTEFYVVRWRDPDGRFLRVDLGPRTLDDGRTPLVERALDVLNGITTVSFVARLTRLGTNVFTVSAHDGALESEPSTVEVELAPARTGAWMLAVDDGRNLAWPVDATEAGRRPTATVETFRPPGRPHPVHLHWGTGGRQTSLRFAYLPGEDGPLARSMTRLLADGSPVYVKAPAGYDWDVMRARVVDVGPETPQAHGWVGLSIDLDEIAPEAPA